jgi:hypothetical protein
MMCNRLGGDNLKTHHTAPTPYHVRTPIPTPLTDKSELAQLNSGCAALKGNNAEPRYIPTYARPKRTKASRALSFDQCRAPSLLCPHHQRRKSGNGAQGLEGLPKRSSGFVRTSNHCKWNRPFFFTISQVLLSSPRLVWAPPLCRSFVKAHKPLLRVFLAYSFYSLIKHLPLFSVSRDAE